ncbi:leucine-rich repeat-containing protein 2 isoform X1 [Hippoglossus stenolepis]|uniref:leucine-rich repeat-containing protein 2 isoform X1 n=2 Tax=Hippoglossus stenolepis TaxID=195615 RepID=UPI00159C1B05|nr:leucine-rich repeat-containing protein 2 isoform X1 [Hippoglossus stenolepis]
MIKADMGFGRKVDVPVSDLSVIRGLWEVRVKKYRQRQKKEQQRVEKSALPRINQQWEYRIYCKSLKPEEQQLLRQYLERSTRPDTQEYTGSDQQQDLQDADVDLKLQLDGDSWKEFPGDLRWRTYLREWHVSGTKICRLPEYLSLFTQLLVLQIPKNSIEELPPAIGEDTKLSGKLTGLRELNVSYNRLSKVPPELGHCENLERLELAGNYNLSELPFELSSLKRLVHLDIAENRFVSIPVCTLRMSGLQLLDLSNNGLSDLPQDMDRLEQLVTLFLHKNKLWYLPHCLSNISTLKMIVVSGEQLTCIPTRLCSNPDIKFIRLCDNLAKKKEEKKEKSKMRRWREAGKEEVKKDSREKEFIEAYISTLTDRVCPSPDTVPYSTTKVSISCLL